MSLFDVNCETADAFGFELLVAPLDELAPETALVFLDENNILLRGELLIVKIGLHEKMA